MQSLSARQRKHQQLQYDLPYYCRNILKVQPKEGGVVPFVLNKAQTYIHNQLEKQLQTTGKVRAVILKGRQQGCSTYIAARYYHKTVWNQYKTVYILSHEAKSTQTLFKKVTTFYESSPEQLKPEAKTANRNELEFSNGSRYSVGTAGSGSTGRSQTAQLFHGSEAAFYENAEEILSGVFQIIGNSPGTEIIIESTANGIGNWFQQTCMDALSGVGEYQLIFVPWFWQEEYTEKTPIDWVFTEREREIQSLYRLTDDQLYWRYLKVSELKSESKFMQEYPCTVREAFQSSGTPLIPAEAVERARKSNIIDPTAPLVIGVDAGRTRDRTFITMRQGRCMPEVKRYEVMDEMRLAGIIANLIDQRNAAKVFIDPGQAYGTIDRLKELGYGGIVQSVHFSTKPTEPHFLNKRAEMAAALRDWFTENDEVSIPDEEELESDLLAVPDFVETSQNKLKLIDKSKIREMYGKSPDFFDSAMLTFAYPVRAHRAGSRFEKRTINTRDGSPLSTLAKNRPKREKQNTTPGTFKVNVPNLSRNF